jgi:cytidyltransferase-like protein
MRHNSLNSNNGVVVWGVFDLLHQGHHKFLENASLKGDLSVILIPDEIAFLNKGYFPLNSTEKRLTDLEKLTYIKRVSVDCYNWGLKSLKEISPQYFCFGYDQSSIWEKKLKILSQNFGLNLEYFRLPQYANGIHTSKIRNRFDYRQI